MTKARTSGSKVYLCFVTKHRQARHGIPRNSFFFFFFFFFFFDFDQEISGKVLRYFSAIGENAMTSSIRIGWLAKKTHAIWKVYGGMNFKICN